MITAKELGNRFRTARYSRNLTQGQVAYKIHSTKSCIGFIENGRGYPSLPVFVKLCELFELDMREVLSWE